MKRVRREVIAVAFVSLVLIGVGTSRLSAESEFSRSSAAAPAGEFLSNPDNSLWIPPDTYTAIVLCSAGTDRRWVVTLQRGNGIEFPIAIPAGETVVIPFEKGWTVKASDNAKITSDNAKITSDSVLWGIEARQAELAGEGYLRLAAWGITAEGPRAFVQRVVK